MTTAEGMFRLDGKVAIITGAARGQGRAMASLLASHGASVAICDIGAKALATVDYPMSGNDDLANASAEIAASGGQVLHQTCDVRSQEQIDAFVAATVARFGRIDILVNNAGILSGNQPVHTLSDEQWTTMIDINLTGVFRFSRAVVPHLIAAGGGRLINIASAASLVGAPGFGHYAAAKHGVVGLTRTMASELAPHRITVNAICPGMVETTMVEHAADALAEQMGTSRTEAYELFLTTHLIKEPTKPSQTAAAVLYLASDIASTVTGSCLSIDGGWTAV